MKRLLSLLLVIAMLFSVCAIFTACDSTSVSDEDDDDDKKKDDDEKKDDEDEVEPTLVFKGLRIVLPEEYELDDKNEYGDNSGYARFTNDNYMVDIQCGPMEGDLEGMSAKEYRDYYLEMMTPEDNDVGEYDVGKKNGTPYLYAIKDDNTAVAVIAFYVDGDYGWLAGVLFNGDSEDCDIDDMIKLVTGWKCKKPDPNEEEEENEGNEGNEGENVIPQPPIADTVPGVEEVVGQVIYDNMGIVVKWTGMEVDDFRTTLQLYIENDSGYNIELYGTDFILNYSATFPANLFCFLGDGESSFFNIDLYESDLARFGAEMVGSLDFTIEVINSSDYQIMDEGTRVSIKTEYDGYYNDLYSAGFVLFDENHVRVIVHEIQMDSFHESFLWLYIENYSDQTVNVSMDDFYSMGWFLADASVYERVLPGTYTIAGVDLSELYDLGIEYPYQMENITGNVYCMDEEYNTLSSGEISYCPGDPDAFYNYEISGTTLYSGEGLEVVLTDIEETEYYVEFTVYFYNSWDSSIRINLGSAVINGYNTDSGMGIVLDSCTQHMGTLWLWYDESYEFTCLDDLSSLVLNLEAHDYGYHEIVYQQIEIPLN